MIKTNRVRGTERYVVNNRGEKTAVIMDYRRYHQLLKLLEDLEDLYVIAERKNNPTIPLEKMKQQLKKNGLL